MEKLVGLDGVAKAWFTLTFKNDKRVIAILMEEMEGIAGKDDFTFMCMLQPLPASVGKHAAAKGENVLGLERIEENAILLLATLRTTDPMLATVVEQKAQA